MLPLAFWLADVIVVVVEGLKHDIAICAGKKAAQKAIEIPTFMVPDAFEQRLKASAPKAYQPLAGQPTLVSVGRLALQKNPQYLIRAFAQTAKRVAGAKLLLVGGGPMEAELRDLTLSNGLAVDDFTEDVPSVIFAGFHDNPMPFLSLGKAFVTASGAEGLPGAVVEAMYAGKLVLAADSTWGARAILEPGEPPADPYPTKALTLGRYGVLLPRIDAPHYEAIWVDAMARALESDAWQQRYEPTANARAMDFAMEKVAPKWTALVEAILQDK
jgi:Glycosyltransferase